MGYRLGKYDAPPVHRCRPPQILDSDSVNDVWVCDCLAAFRLHSDKNESLFWWDRDVELEKRDGGQFLLNWIEEYKA